jgi:selenocysteine-specific elongation factor
LAEGEGGRRLTLGTAGHIDHGKTALIGALTGSDTDRLPDEHRRGISIELGYARLGLPGEDWLSVVDVPGHERLVRTMVAGATGVDLFLLAIAVDDGVMPQTREHVAVLRALGVERGVVALTKRDLVDDDALEVAADEARALLPGIHQVAVSAKTGEGVEELRAQLAGVAAGVVTEDGPHAEGPAVLHVDRSFTMRGIGTVVTGTLWSGTIVAGDRVELLPRALTARARSVQVHGEPVERAGARQRVALNLGGVERAEVERGDVVVSPGSGLRASYRLDVELRLEPSSRPVAGRRVQVHHGTRDTPARVVALDDRSLAQLRLSGPLIARPGERFVLREIAPANTIGGGVVLDPAPARHGPGPAAERLAAIRERGLELVLAEEEAARRAPGGGRATSGQAPSPKLDRAAGLVLAVLDADGAEPRPPAAIASALRLEPERVERSLAALVEAGDAVRSTPQVYFSARRLEPLRERATALAGERGEIALPELRDALGTSRKYAQAILDHLDGTGVTVRHGDRHVLRRPVGN